LDDVSETATTHSFSVTATANEDPQRTTTVTSYSLEITDS